MFQMQRSPPERQHALRFRRYRLLMLGLPAGLVGSRDCEVVVLMEIEARKDAVTYQSAARALGTELEGGSFYVFVQPGSLSTSAD